MAATAAIALAGDLPSINAAILSDPLNGGLIDVNVSLGRWPLRRLPFDDTSALAAKLRKHGVTQAWAGNFDAVFGKDFSAANEWLAAECRKRGRGLFVPFGTVNPILPDWENELRRCHEEHKMPGIRLFPNYHGYKLGEPGFSRLLASVAERKLVVQISVSIEDERTQNSSARAPLADVKPLLTLLKAASAPRIVLLNWHRGVSLALTKQLAELGVSFDIATVEGVGGVAGLLEKIPPGRVLFGSHAPFFYFEAAQLKLKESGLNEETEREICSSNARRLL